ncbi:hypothetical protein MHYP_G00092160 [Metynnis hypsauchen]
MMEQQQIITEFEPQDVYYRGCNVSVHEPVLMFHVSQVLEDSYRSELIRQTVKDEFRRITAANLERTSLTKLDFYTPNLLTVFEMKGGAAGTKTRCRLDSPGQQQEGRRDAVIRCLIHFLGESCEELIKDYQDLSKGRIKDSFVDLVMKIIVVASAAAEEGAAPDSVIIVIDGTEIWKADIANRANLHCGFQTGEQINVSGCPRTGECNRFERHHHRVKDRNALQNHLRVREDQQQTVEMILPCGCRRTDLLRSAESSQRRSAEKLFPHMRSLDPETQHHHS